MIYFHSFLYVCLLISRSPLAYYPLGLKNWPAGSVICSRWTWLRLDGMDEKLNNAYWISLYFAINFLSLQGSKQLIDEWNKKKFENYLKDVVVDFISTLYLLIIDCPLDLIPIHRVYYDCQRHLCLIFYITLLYLYFCT